MSQSRIIQLSKLNRLSSLGNRFLSNKNPINPNPSEFSEVKPELPASEHPFNRTIRILKDDMKYVKSFFTTAGDALKNIVNTEPQLHEPGQIINPYDIFQEHCDVLILGSGAIGSSVAYWLKEKARDGLNVVVVDNKDFSQRPYSSLDALTVGGLRRQFALEENIEMALYGSLFLRTVKERLGESVDVQYKPHSCLFLACEEEAEELHYNAKLQNEIGARNRLLTATQLSKLYPWLNTTGIALGCIGQESEGSFDPNALTMGLRCKALEHGAHFHTGDVIGFEFKEQPDIIMHGVEMGQYRGIEKVVLRLPTGEIRSIKFAICVLATSENTVEIAEMAGVGRGRGILQFPVPIGVRKHYTYAFEYEAKKGHIAPGLNVPLTIDVNNTYFKRLGLNDTFIVGQSPILNDNLRELNQQIPSLEEYFETNIKPHFKFRVPAFDELILKESSSRNVEINEFDESGIIGPHPYYNNLYFMNGFDGFGK